jgi:hypothetical protein
MRVEQCAQYLAECERDIREHLDWVVSNFHLPAQDLLEHLKAMYQHYTWTVKLVTAAYSTLAEEEKRLTSRIVRKLHLAFAVMMNRADRSYDQYEQEARQAYRKSLEKKPRIKKKKPKEAKCLVS